MPRYICSECKQKFESGGGFFERFRNPLEHSICVECRRIQADLEREKLKLENKKQRDEQKHKEELELLEKRKQNDIAMAEINKQKELELAKINSEKEIALQKEQTEMEALKQKRIEMVRKMDIEAKKETELELQTLYKSAFDAAATNNSNPDLIMRILDHYTERSLYQLSIKDASDN
jgi:uncharacterized membrane protein YqiK